MDAVISNYAMSYVYELNRVCDLVWYKQRRRWRHTSKLIGLLTPTRSLNSIFAVCFAAEPEREREREQAGARRRHGEVGNAMSAFVTTRNIWTFSSFVSMGFLPQHSDSIYVCLCNDNVLMIIFVCACVFVCFRIHATFKITLYCHIFFSLSFSLLSHLIFVSLNK